MNDIEKRVDDILGDNEAKDYKLRTHLTDYITKLLNDVVPENQVYITDEPRKDEFWKAGFNDCLNLIKQNIAKKLEEGKVDEKR